MKNIQNNSIYSNFFRNELFRWGELSVRGYKSNKFLFSNDKMWFAYSRQALRTGMQMLGIEAKDSVLIPSYICNVIESSFYPDNIAVIYYKVTEDLSPDFNDIKNKITKTTKALLFVNYFGYPAEILQLKEFCKEYNLFLIEDNAHGFLSKDAGNWLGSFGDISVTSIYKKLPIFHGAYLQINCLTERGSENNSSFYINKRFVKYFYNYFHVYFNRIIFNKKIEPGINWDNQPIYLPDPMMNVELHSFAVFQIGLLNYESIYQNKIKKYNVVMSFIEKELSSAGILLFEDLVPGALPLQVPFLVDLKNKEKMELFEYIRRKNIEIFRWPDLPDAVAGNLSEFPLSNYYQNNLFQFPI